jgi:HAD superfamily hydrolase (TIGR01509 family)
MSAMPLSSPEAAAFLFDLDGVLVDTASLVRGAWRRFAAERGVVIADAEFPGRFFGRRTADILVDVFAIERASAEALAGAGLDDKTAEIEAGAPLPEISGAVDFVRATIAAGLAVALVSSASATNVRLALHRLGLEDAFAVIVHAGSVARGKPAPDPYLEACAELHVAPASAVVFEDSLPGIAAAHAAGARCVALATSEPRERLIQADLVVDDFRGLQPGAVLAALSGRRVELSR